MDSVAVLSLFSSCRNHFGRIPLIILCHRRGSKTSTAPKPNSIEGNRVPATTVAEGRDSMFTELGQLGDSFGGLNALLTAIAGALVFWAGYMQLQTLKQMRASANSELANRKIQEFESLFFRLLELTSTSVERVQGPKRGHNDLKRPIPQRKGTRALDSFARSLYDSVGSHRGDHLTHQEVLEALVKEYLTKVYDRQPSGFGPYFRLLYQTFKHIEESELSEIQKIRYANIARGQISEGAVLLLALNGLTPIGYKFVPLIERFGLLEHMHRRYRVEYEASLFLGYRKRAFSGSQERAAPGNEWEKKPLLAEDHFAHLVSQRAQADSQR